MQRHCVERVFDLVGDAAGEPADGCQPGRDVELRTQLPPGLRIAQREEHADRPGSG